jgi:hypothetical protein
MYEIGAEVTDTARDQMLSKIFQNGENGTIRKMEETCSWKNIGRKPRYMVPF